MTAPSRNPGTGPPASPLGPLRHPVFRAFWAASLASNVGTWMQSIAATWSMTSLSADPLLTALVQTATSLPVLFLGLPAGALADVVDRRRLLIGAQAWMLLSAAALALVTWAGLQTPWTLLGLTFSVGMGAALAAPAWQASTIDLVPRAEIPQAAALGSASMNLSRAVGPALGGLVVARLGPAAAFALNAISFLAVIAVLVPWRPRPAASALPREHVFGAIRAGLRYVRHAAHLRAVYVRTAGFVIFASGLWALLPLVARDHMGLEATGYGVLLACLGLGAVLGVGLLPRLRARLGVEGIVSGASLTFAAATTAIALAPPFPVACGVLLLAGLSWTTPLSSLVATIQSHSPAWVRARALAVQLLVLQGSLAAGSALWGAVASRHGVVLPLALAAGGLALSTFLARPYRVGRRDDLDLTPAGRLAAGGLLVDAAEPDRGPVLVTIEYRIDPERADDFRSLMQRVEGVRRRDGAFRWRLFSEAGDDSRWLEVFLVESWLEHMRQHERMTVSARQLIERTHEFHLGPEPPHVRHLLAELPGG